MLSFPFCSLCLCSVLVCFVQLQLIINQGKKERNRRQKISKKTKEQEGYLGSNFFLNLFFVNFWVFLGFLDDFDL